MFVFFVGPATCLTVKLVYDVWVCLSAVGGVFQSSLVAISVDEGIFL